MNEVKRCRLWGRGPMIDDEFVLINGTGGTYKRNPKLADFEQFN